MGRLLCMICFTLLSLLAHSQVQKEYQLVWSDEFDVDGEPSTEWSYEYGFQRNEELQWYQSQNAKVKDGCLVIEAKKGFFINPHYEAGSSDWRKNREFIRYTSSCLTTRFSQQFLYGRFEIRAKIPVASGAWPAIWLLGNKWEWPNNGEIDIMEYYIKDGQPSILANACWGSTEKWKAIWDSAVIPFTHFTEKDPYWADKFHIWRMDWDKEFIRIYLDDELLNEIDLSKTFNDGFEGNRENPFVNNVVGFGHYLLLNLAVGSNGGDPNDSQFPLRYYIDYVRVYQK
ncbi:MAG: glycoside hydrolase family 16 protein [Prevotella sp.]|nr:glycoside hydrolase family 16 protein [Prevotella sp.]